MQKIPTWIVQTVAIVGVLAGFDFWINQQQNNRLGAVEMQLGEVVGQLGKVVTQLAVIEALQTERKEEFTEHVKESGNLRSDVAGAREDIAAIKAEMRVTNDWLEKFLDNLPWSSLSVMNAPPGGTEAEKMN